MASFLSLIVIAVLLLHKCVLVHGADTPVVSITSGKVVGQEASLATGHRVRQYLGIPFAEAERFKPPKAPTKWSVTKRVTEFGKACPQVLNPLFGLKANDSIGEDCLNLNIYTPNGTNSDSALPVMVYFHGGSYTVGLNRIYDGSALAAIGDVIVVIPQYRLGILGFITNGRDLKGNYGMLDQVEALKWVKANIKRFGGDPDKVTIFGNSAGGSSVALHLISPRSNGLFKNAILQSGSAVAYWAAAYKDEAIAMARSAGRALNCTSLETLADCLRTTPLSGIALQSALSIVEAIGHGYAGIVPVVDGDFLPDTPRSLLEKGNFNKVNVIIGVVNNEGLILTSAIPGVTIGLDVSKGLTRAEFLAVFKTLKLTRNLSPPVTESILYRYTDWSDVDDPIANRQMYTDMVGDSMFKAPAVLSADAFANETAAMQTFVYSWDHRLPNYPGTNQTIPPWIGVFHGSEAFFLITQGVDKVLTGPDTNFTLDAITRWTNFAKSGNPNIPNNVSVHWPQYTTDSQRYLSIKPRPEAGAKLRPDHMTFWNKYIPTLIRALPTTSIPPTTRPCPISSGQDSIRRTGNMALVMAVVFNVFMFLLLL